MLFFAVILFFGSAMGLSLWLKSSDERRVEDSFARDLKMLTVLPRLEMSVRQGDLPRARALVAPLAETGHGGQIDELVSDLEEQLRQAAQSRGRPDWVDRRHELDVLLGSMGRAAAADLEGRKTFLENAALRRTMLRAFFEAAGAVLIAIYLFYFIVTPIVAFESSARRWSLGQAWVAPPAPAIPELRSLMARFSQMAERLNAQYEREKELNDFKTRLVSLVSHDFNNSLTIIRNAAYLLQETTPASATGAARYLRMIDTHTRALNAEVNNLLSMARLEAGKLAVNMTRTDGERILREAIVLFGSVAEDKKLKIELELPEMIAPLRADPATLGLVVNNLLSNAVKYTPEKGRIDVGLAPERGRGDLYRIFVRDTGVGISVEDQAKILRGYYRTERGNRLTSKGFGIGLSLSRQIIEAHGSELRIDSEPGKGSTFSFALPVWKEEKRA